MTGGTLTVTVICRDESWFDVAACRGCDVNVFFPVEPNNWEEPLAFCRRCPVVTECLEFALRFSDDQDRDGMFGARTPHQRARIRYKRMHNL